MNCSRTLAFSRSSGLARILLIPLVLMLARQAEAADMGSWWRIGVYDEGLAAEFERMGVTAENASEWKNNGFSLKSLPGCLTGTPIGVTDLIPRFTVSEAIRWKAAGLDFEYACGWHKYHFSLEEAQIWIKIGVTKPASAYRYSQSHITPEMVKQRLNSVKMR